MGRGHVNYSLVNRAIKPVEEEVLDMGVVRARDVRRRPILQSRRKYTAYGDVEIPEMMLRTS